MTIMHLAVCIKSCFSGSRLWARGEVAPAKLIRSECFRKLEVQGDPPENVYPYSRSVTSVAALDDPLAVKPSQADPVKIGFRYLWVIGTYGLGREFFLVTYDPSAGATLTGLDEEKASRYFHGLPTRRAHWNHPTERVEELSDTVPMDIAEARACGELL